MDKEAFSCFLTEVTFDDTEAREECDETELIKALRIQTEAFDLLLREKVKNENKVKRQGRELRRQIQQDLTKLVSSLTAPPTHQKQCKRPKVRSKLVTSSSGTLPKFDVSLDKSNALVTIPISENAMVHVQQTEQNCPEILENIKSFLALDQYTGSSQDNMSADGPCSNFPDLQLEYEKQLRISQEFQTTTIEDTEEAQQHEADDNEGPLLMRSAEDQEILEELLRDTADECPELCANWTSEESSQRQDSSSGLLEYETDNFELDETGESHLTAGDEWALWPCATDEQLSLVCLKDPEAPRLLEQLNDINRRLQEFAVEESQISNLMTQSSNEKTCDLKHAVTDESGFVDKNDRSLVNSSENSYIEWEDSEEEQLRLGEIDRKLQTIRATELEQNIAN